MFLFQYCHTSKINQKFYIDSISPLSTGNVSVGNLPKFLPFVLSEIERQPKKQYLLLHSLKEVRYIIEKSCNHKICCLKILQCYSITRIN